MELLSLSAIYASFRSEKTSKSIGFKGKSKNSIPVSKKNLLLVIKKLPRDNEIPEGCANDVFVELSHAKKEEDT